MFSPDQIPNPRDRKKLFDDIVEKSLPFTRFCYRNPETGNCSECGACCARVLPLTPGELQALKGYIQKKPQLRKYILALNKDLPKAMCPFLDYTKPNHKCMIYESGVLPSVCQHYSCNKKMQEKRFAEHFADTVFKMKPVDLWFAFFRSATQVSDIALPWHCNDLLMNRCGMCVPRNFLENPDKLSQYFGSIITWKEFLKMLLPTNNRPFGFDSWSEQEARQFFLKHFAPK